MIDPDQSGGAVASEVNPHTSDVMALIVGANFLVANAVHMANQISQANVASHQAHVDRTLERLLQEDNIWEVVTVLDSLRLPDKQVEAFGIQYGNVIRRKYKKGWIIEYSSTITGRKTVIKKRPSLTALGKWIFD